jgi:hypothetical protein
MVRLPVSPPPVRPMHAKSPAASAPAASGDFIEQLFAQMALDKALPKYQFERRVDAFLAILLPDLLAQTFGGDVSYVVPEFPIKKPGNNQSTNVDHVYFDHRGRWLFVEIKTDRDSESDGQVGTYLSAIARGMPALVADIHDIRAATVKRAKYDMLLERLAGYPLDLPIELVYLAPAGGETRFPPAVKLLDYARLGRLNHRAHPEVWTAFRNRLVPALM